MLHLVSLRLCPHILLTSTRLSSLFAPSSSLVPSFSLGASVSRSLLLPWAIARQAVAINEDAGHQQAGRCCSPGGRPSAGQLPPFSRRRRWQSTKNKRGGRRRKNRKGENDLCISRGKDLVLGGASWTVLQYSIFEFLCTYVETWYVRSSGWCFRPERNWCSRKKGAETE